MRIVGRMEDYMAQQLDEHRRRWEENLVQPALKKLPERKQEFVTDSDIGIQRLYLPEDQEYLKKLLEL